MNISRPSCIALMLCTAAMALCSAAGAAPRAAAAGLALAAQESAAVGKQPELNPKHPDRYVVKRGDTLWDISAMFLKEPWYWPEIWYANPQIENPHLIYPGDVLTLVYVNGQPRIQLERGAAGGTEKLSPRVREEALANAIPTIPLEKIAAFLGRGSILQKHEYEKMPHVVSVRGQHMVGSAGNDVYVRGKVAGIDSGYTVVHVGDELRDPDDGDLLGYEGIYVGAGTIRRLGDPATLFLNDTAREALPGDRLVAQSANYPAYFTPSAPAKPVEGSIIAVVDGTTQAGQYEVIAVNRGTRHGLAPGNVLAVWQRGERVPDVETVPGSAYRHSTSGAFGGNVQLPDEPAGLAMVFRTYDRVSYALILRASSEIHVLDIVKSPD